ncbi:hypothetical protein PoB_005085600 [Plakobranchus ocellatus]|uniref:Uncharacterized protein n=1 Tax=Plakobranchus ocellatus TaxID=259542 RepID=A0AAV4BV17_9GAST|nr:hypothetical protein PoB_005085600 [Plakobranchus ocellatus]
MENHFASSDLKLPRSASEVKDTVGYHGLTSLQVLTSSYRVRPPKLRIPLVSWTIPFVSSDLKLPRSACNIKAPVEYHGATAIHVLDLILPRLASIIQPSLTFKQIHNLKLCLRSSLPSSTLQLLLKRRFF